MTLLAAPLRSRTFPIAAASLAVVLISIAAYAGRIPAALTAHGVDKVLHASMAAVLTGCLARALRGRALLAALLVMAPLALDEYLQRFSSRRSSDWGDLVADLAGAFAVVAISALWKRRRLG
ncbi:MAG: VanZ family protein [Deltaproteobacteria bacterium]|nr:VanZ family protein [Deltaproteobacteria bacterium]